VISDHYAPLLEENLKGAQKGVLAARARAWAVSRVRGPWLAAQELRNWLSLLALALVPSGLLAFMIYGKIMTGDLLATFHNQNWGWGRYLKNPLGLFLYSFRHPIAANPMDWNFWILNISLACIFLGLCVWALRKLPMTYALYTLGMVLLPLSSSRINSISRYFLIVFPVYILFAFWSSDEKHTMRRYLLMTLLGMLQAVFMVFFVLGLPAIA
jgi:hypothetical protein